MISEQNKKNKIQATWYDMIQRCSNSGVKCWKWYGGRGIEVCERWSDLTTVRIHTKGRPSKKGFKNFFDDMQETWFPGATIDRIDNDGDYTPENCQWLSKTENRAKIIYTDERKDGVSRQFKGIPKTTEMKNKVRNKLKGNKNGASNRGSLSVYDMVERKCCRITVEDYHLNRGIRYLNLRSRQYKELINDNS